MKNQYIINSIKEFIANSELLEGYELFDYIKKPNSTVIIKKTELREENFLKDNYAVFDLSFCSCIKKRYKKVSKIDP